MLADTRPYAEIIGDGVEMARKWYGGKAGTRGESGSRERSREKRTLTRREGTCG